MTGRSYRYQSALRTAPDCIHGQQGGDIVRPWTATPACALCRQRHYVHWRTLDEPAPIPPPAPRTAATRRLF